MRFFLLCLGFLFFTQTSFSQKLNLNVCNEIGELEPRNKCLKSTLDNLFVKELLQISLELKEEDGAEFDVSFEVEVSRVGLFALRNFESNTQGVYEAFNQIVFNLTPLSSYKHKNKLVSSTFSFDYSLRLLENSTLEIFQNNIRVYSNVRPFNKKEKIVFPEPENINEVEDSTSKANEVISPFAVVENVPVFPGCESLKTNAELKNCMSDNISSFVISNFDLEIANKLDMPDGKVRINMQFKINKDGYVTDIMARAPHTELEQEAIRVINSLPKFEPGKHRGERVNVMYSLPIVFQVESNTKTKKQ